MEIANISVLNDFIVGTNIKIHIFIFRIYKHIRKEEGGVSVGDALYETYVAECLDGPLSITTFKRLISQIHGVKTTFTHRNRERVGIFKGLIYVQTVTTTPQPAISDTELPCGWFKVANDEHSQQLTVAKKTEISVEGVPIMKEVTVDQAHNVTVSVGNHKVCQEELGLPSNLEESNLTLNDYLQVSISFPIFVHFPEVQIVDAMLLLSHIPHTENFMTIYWPETINCKLSL